MHIIIQSEEGKKRSDVVQIQPECPSCVALQLMRTVQRRKIDNWRSVMADTLASIAGLWGDADNPGHIIGTMYTKVNLLTDTHDAYRAERSLANQLAQTYWNGQPLAIDNIEGRMLYATAGNIIDAGLNADPTHSFTQLDQAIGQGFGRNDIAGFFDQVPKGGTILYVTDNAGEAVFDREVVTALKARGYKIWLLVRGRPFLNDLTRIEAELLGFRTVADHILDTGTGQGGFDPRYAGFDAQRATQQVDGWIVKGIANLETLSHQAALQPRLFLYRAKCPPSARLAGVLWNDNVALME